MRTRVGLVITLGRAFSVICWRTNQVVQSQDVLSDQCTEEHASATRGLCGACAVCDAWMVCGTCVVHVWYMCGVCVVHVWCMCGACMVHVWFICGACVVHVGCMYGPFVVFVWCLCDVVLVWCGVEWCGWCGVVWCGVVWCGVVWCMWYMWYMWYMSYMSYMSYMWLHSTCDPCYVSHTVICLVILHSTKQQWKPLLLVHFLKNPHQTSIHICTSVLHK